jgi:hypothetical protein
MACILLISEGKEENRKEVKHMKIATSFLSALFIVGALGVSDTPATAEVLSKVELGSNYCHLRFPAIRKDTLNSDRPVLKDPSSRDIIDYYGPCDHDPLGKDEIASQKRRAEEERELPEGDFGRR